MTTHHHRYRLDLSADFDVLITDVYRATVDEHGAVVDVNPDAMPSLCAESDDEWRGEFVKYLESAA